MSTVPRWTTFVAWSAILAAAAFIASRAAREADPRSAASVEAEMKARAGFGVRELAGAKSSTLEEVELDLSAGDDAAMHQRAIILDYELRGLKRASRMAWHWDAEAGREGGEALETQRVLRALYPESPPAGETQGARVAALPPADAELLAGRLGWFGRLALAPKDGDAQARRAVMDSAKRTAAAFAVGAALGIGGLLVGIVVLLTALALVFVGRLRPRLAIEDGRAFGAQSFAVWMALFVGFTLLQPLLPHARSPRLAIGLWAEFASLAALAAPLAWGVRWTEIRRRIGWTRGAGFGREICAGVVGLLFVLPLIAAGIFASFLLVRLTGHEKAPGEGAHPIVRFLAESTAGDAFLIFLSAAVAAPLIEETMFRGVLYLHLREAGGRLPRVLSIAFAALVSGVLFASLHPQGWTAVPVLASMGFGLALVREWRGSLVATMVVHGIWNGTLLALVRLALSP